MRKMTAHPGLNGEAIYLDYNATTPVDPAVVAAMQPYLDTRFGNPSSAHRYATTPAEALATARGRVAALIGSDPAGIVFTGSGSEADNLAIRGTILASPGRRRQVITQATEHPAVLATCRALHRLHGVEVTVLPVDEYGLIDPQHLQAAITPHTPRVDHAGEQRDRHHPADRRTRRHRPRPRRAAAHRRRPSRRQNPHRRRRARRRPAHRRRAQDVRAQRHRRPLRAPRA